MTVPDYGESPNHEKIKIALEISNAKWTPEGWVVEGDLYLYGLGLTKLPLIKKSRWGF